MENNFNYSLIKPDDFEILINFIFKKNQSRSEIFSDENIKKIINENLSFKCMKIKENEKDELIACVLLTKREKEILIFLINVKEEYRRKGIGSKIMTESINNARLKLKNEKDIFFSLHVNITNNKALNMYKKLGFVIEKYLEKFYINMIPKGKEKEIGKCYDAYEMILK